MSPVLVLVALLAAQSPAAAPLVGKWGMGGAVLFEFRANGTGVSEGERFTWKVQGQNLVLTSNGETEVVPFALVDGSLVIAPGGMPLQLERVGKAPAGGKQARATPPAQAPSGGAPGAKVPRKDPLAKLLLSSAWCSFSYNQTTGYSSSERFQFFPDGTYQAGRQGEGYSSGGGGTWASQSNTGSSGQWTVKKSALHMSLPPEQPALVPLQTFIKRSSNGTPIVVVNGTEYSPCS